jgi:hypothetical protein
MSREKHEMSEEAWWTQFDHREVDEYGNYPGQTEYERKQARRKRKQ